MSEPSFPGAITSLDQLREHYRQPSKLVQNKKVAVLDEPTKAFIAASPFVLLATADVSGRCDVSPRGGELGLRGVSLDVRPGEILGIAGVDGNGQRELAEAIAGQRPAAAGDIAFQGVSIARLSVWQRERMGLRYVSDDRMGEGTVAGLPVGLNLVLKRIGQAPFWRRGTIRHAEVERNAREKIAEYAIRTPGAGTRVGTLSGGNIQKVVLARELSHDPKLVVYNKPTYGLDIVTTRMVRERIEALASGGVSALVISTDLEELVALCDRIAVISRGRIAGVVENGPGAEQRVGELMVGGQAEAA